MRIVIFDPGLKNRSGHHYNYDLAIIEAVKGLGLPVTLYGHRQADDPAAVAELDAQPMFYWSGYDNLFSFLPFPQNVEYEAVIFSLQLLQFPAHELKAEDVVIFHSLPVEGLYGIALWLDHISRDAIPHIVISFTCADYRDEESGELTDKSVLYGKALAEIASRAGDRVRCLAESIYLQGDLEKLSQGAVQFYPAPHFKPQRHIEDAMGAAEQRQTPPLRIGYFGHSSRVGKGTVLLPDIVARVNAVLGKQVEFCIQGDFSKTTFARPEDRSRIEALREVENVNWIDEAMTAERYYRELAAIDILLLPYSEHYSRGGSGLFYEGLVMGKVLVIPAHGVLRAELESVGGETALFEGWNADAVAGAVIEAVERHERFSLSCRAAGRAWAADHDINAFFSDVASWAGGSPSDD
jgi:glycosyltransferase involved in cell wall biosynthesis